MALTSHAFDQRFYEEHRSEGLDYAAYGDWQRNYGRWLVEVFSLEGKRVLDVGCACGAQLRGLVEAGALGDGVDVSEYMVAIGRQRNPQGTLHVCPSHDLSRFPDSTFDLVHTHNSAEHWAEDLVPISFREFHRVAKPGAILFAVIDTLETLNLSGNGDPTHVTFQPQSWWREMARAAGWQLTDSYDHRLRYHALTYLDRYAWSWFAAERDTG